MQARILCADIGGSFIDFAVLDHRNALANRRKEPTPTRDFNAFLNCLHSMAAPYPGVPLHIAMAGTQEPKTGALTTANIPCMDGTSFASLLNSHLKRTVRVANDADCFVMGEAHFGVARGHDNVFGIILGTGVGGGMIWKGQLILGGGGVSGEWGHAPIIPHLPDLPNATPCFPCGCGQKGCLDTFGSARGLERLHLWNGFAPCDSHSIVAAWEAGENDATKTIDVYLNYTSAALALVINTTGATIIPVGGGLSNAHKLVSALDHAVRKRILHQQDAPLVVPGTLGPDAALLGASALT
ncbi:ROK family protein [Neokomagataea thailandica NBRC 106555]|uniref:ROK family protein n=2 Tax=Neokomagataea TaxID=1223423 RepID=A0A4Y6V9N0_9PROT|nr:MULTISPECIES: ROK family protein [Neokomagataea]QDH25196.1 ROK family protein [Neokomagataea tanensis]GBR53424.1 ROK family protein [Neokomagataea thailandica NBRC 106555]